MDIWMQLLLGVTIIGFGAIIAFLWIIVEKYFFLKTKVNERFEKVINERVEQLLWKLIFKFEKLILEFEDSEIKRVMTVALSPADNIAMESPMLVDKLFDFCDSKVQAEHLSNMRLARESVLEFCQLYRKCAIQIYTLGLDEKLDIISSEDVDFEASFYNKAKYAIDKLERYLD